jgi:hypothetical protein
MFAGKAPVPGDVRCRRVAGAGHEQQTTNNVVHVSGERANALLWFGSVAARQRYSTGGVVV